MIITNPIDNPLWEPSAEGYLEGILLRNNQIERMQKEINDLALKAKGCNDYKEWADSIESYTTVEL